MSGHVVIFGGTFDPVQDGHMAVAREAQAAVQPDEFWFLVANIPGERKPAYAPALLRLEMVRAAVGEDRRFAVVDREIRRGGVTYTKETMDELHGASPDTRYDLLLGADSARTIRAWRYGEDILQREWFLIVNRSGEAPLTVDEAVHIGYDAERVRLLEVASPPVSSSEVRRRVAAGQPLDGLVPRAVIDIIQRDRLYARPDDRA